MQVLNSEWLIKMLEKSGETPETRLLKLFDVLSDWVEAPQINILLKQENTSSPHLLLHYLTQQAKEAGAAMPEMLAEQLVFLVSSALKSYAEDAQSESLSHAKQAAKALITAQCEREAIHINKSTIYSALAVFICSITIGVLIYKNHYADATINNIATNQANISPTSSMFDKTKEIAGNPKHTAEMYASIETMRGGDCQFIEALQIPDADKKIYLENVVGGQVPTNAHDQMIAQRYMQKIRCNYTPMLMKNSTN